MLDNFEDSNNFFTNVANTNNNLSLVGQIDKLIDRCEMAMTSHIYIDWYQALQTLATISSAKINPRKSTERIRIRSKKKAKEIKDNTPSLFANMENADEINESRTHKVKMIPFYDDFIKQTDIIELMLKNRDAEGNEIFKHKVGNNSRFKSHPQIFNYRFTLIPRQNERRPNSSFPHDRIIYSNLQKMHFWLNDRLRESNVFGVEKSIKTF